MLSQDTALALALLVTFATFVTTHCVLTYVLIRRHQPAWQAWLALFPPTAWLAPVLAHRLGLRRHLSFWVLSLTSYALVLAMAQL